jgi:hypothetical protein
LLKISGLIKGIRNPAPEKGEGRGIEPKIIGKTEGGRTGRKLRGRTGGNWEAGENGPEKLTRKQRKQSTKKKNQSKEIIHGEKERKEIQHT